MATGCNFNGSFGPQLKGSGVAKTEERAVDAFSEILVEGPIELELTVGPTASVVVTADDNILPHVVTDVAGDRLRISVDASYSTSLGVKVKATTPALTRTAGSSGRVDVHRVAMWRPSDFELDLSGASRCTFDRDTSMSVRDNDRGEPCDARRDQPSELNVDLLRRLARRSHGHAGRPRDRHGGGRLDGIGRRCRRIDRQRLRGVDRAVPRRTGHGQAGH